MGEMEFDMHVEHIRTHTSAHTYSHTRSVLHVCVCGAVFERIYTGMNACGVFPWELNALWGNFHIENIRCLLCCLVYHMGKYVGLFPAKNIFTIIFTFLKSHEQMELLRNA